MRIEIKFGDANLNKKRVYFELQYSILFHKLVYDDTVKVLTNFRSSIPAGICRTVNEFDCTNWSRCDVQMSSTELRRIQSKLQIHGEDDYK